MEPEPVALTTFETNRPLVDAALVDAVKLILPEVVNPTVPVEVLALLMVLTVPTCNAVLSTKVTEPVLPANVLTALAVLSKV